MNINLMAVVLASIAEFIIGAIWYMPVFGKLWGKIHGFDHLSKEEQAAMQKGMTPLMGAQFASTLVTTYVLAGLINALPDYSDYNLALMAWLGFVVPTQVAAVIFGNTPKKWFVTKTLIMAGGSLLCLLVAAAILKAIV